MTIHDLFWLFPVVLTVYLLWQHGTISALARIAARRHCQNAGVQFLDQSVVLKKLRFRRISGVNFRLERHYAFEFSSLGDTRYGGVISMRGRSVSEIELEPFKVIERETLQ